ncbi:22845_t:CDS:2 [Dentiscutata erythropus]|uniref:22845_t:CDS:1 n=1 Tax=Dentiscutata erythropus TaxID=1348616 RepID=A0A9N9GXY4_9GLOM|nr:22845_t:CDS:2 [Dentiscutata erythropus]
MDAEPLSPAALRIPTIQISESPGPNNSSVENRKGRKSLSKSIPNLHGEESSEGGSTDDGLMSPKVIRKTNVLKESFDDFIKRRRNALEKQRSTISLYTSPVLVMTYFLSYVIHQAKNAVEYARSRKWVLTAVPVLGVLIQFTLLVEGAHKEIIYRVQTLVFWYCYWICLGIASSIGLGTGLHTFVLFLGPFIAEVTWAANKCGNLDFEIFGPNRFRCQPMVTTTPISISVWSVVSKVQWESFFWGLGTALGELPPYFVARAGNAAALSGSRSEELAQLNALLEQSPERMTMKEKLLMTTHRLLRRLGFFGIFLFASIPNPLFDLAGIICGQFLVPFSTFFGATFLGKAVVKSSIQSIIVILLFSRDTIETILKFTQKYIPYIHDKLENMIQRQTRMLRREKGEDAYDIGPGNPSYISLAWNTLFNLMLAYFALSIIETLAISHLKRVHDQEIENLERKANANAIRNGDGTDDDSTNSPKRRGTIGGNYKRERSLKRGYESS